MTTALEDPVQVAEFEIDDPCAQRTAVVGRGGPIVDRSGAGATRDRTTRNASVVEGRIDRGARDPEVNETFQLAAIRQPPVGVARKRRGVQNEHLCRKRLLPVK